MELDLCTSVTSANIVPITKTTPLRVAKGYVYRGKEQQVIEVVSSFL